MEDVIEIFDAGVRYLIQKKRASGEKCTLTMIAKSFGEKTGHLSQGLSGKRAFGEEKRKQVAKYFGKTYTEVLNIGSELLALGGKIEKKPDLLLEEPKKTHRETIEDFIDKDLARDVNVDLVKLEKADRKAFLRVYENIKNELKMLGLKPEREHFQDSRNPESVERKINGTTGL